ncbi:hypothetical protein DFJ73DRAFT_529987 [Zopfochytrium polystomum]|nr:hypothetical protein DFJ73DRAFT_529987 [Zopfochytrium polystomum]
MEAKWRGEAGLHEFFLVGCALVGSRNSSVPLFTFSSCCFLSLSRAFSLLTLFVARFRPGALGEIDGRNCRSPPSKKGPTPPDNFGAKLSGSSVFFLGSPLFWFASPVISLFAAVAKLIMRVGDNQITHQNKQTTKRPNQTSQKRKGWRACVARVVCMGRGGLREGGRG